MNKHAKITNRMLTNEKRNRDGEQTAEESFGGCRGLESDETGALLAVSLANDARCCNHLLKKQICIVQCAKGISYSAARLRFIAVTKKKFHRLHERKRLSRYKKVKPQGFFSKRVERVALRTCA
jgi:hypothetical protein